MDPGFRRDDDITSWPALRLRKAAAPALGEADAGLALEDQQVEGRGLALEAGQQAMRLAARGLRNKSIADILSISEGTVKIHLHNVYKKLPIDSRLGLTLYARDKGLV